MRYFRNRTTNDRCARCLDDGLIVVGTQRHLGVDCEQYGPCPVCEVGAELEFPTKGGRAPWGEDGFWASRQTLKHEIMSVTPPPRESLPTKENLARMRQLMSWLGIKPLDDAPSAASQPTAGSPEAQSAGHTPTFHPSTTEA